MKDKNYVECKMQGGSIQRMKNKNYEENRMMDRNIKNIE